MNAMTCYIVSQLSCFLPHIEFGVQLRALAVGGINQIIGAVHYLQPGRSSLRSRVVYMSEGDGKSR
jgi:hypothetical protein